MLRYSIDEGWGVDQHVPPQPTSLQQMDLMRSVITECMNSFRASVHEEMQNIHLVHRAMLRSFSPRPLRACCPCPTHALPNACLAAEMARISTDILN
jgi:hypothetical protein